MIWQSFHELLATRDLSTVKVSILTQSNLQVCEWRVLGYITLRFPLNSRGSQHLGYKQTGTKRSSAMLDTENVWEEEKTSENAWKSSIMVMLRQTVWRKSDWSLSRFACKWSIFRPAVQLEGLLWNRTNANVCSVRVLWLRRVSGEFTGEHHSVCVFLCSVSAGFLSVSSSLLRQCVDESVISINTVKRVCVKNIYQISCMCCESWCRVEWGSSRCVSMHSEL